MAEAPLWTQLPADSFLEYAFLRWVLAAGAAPQIARMIVPQQEVVVGDRHYRVDYVIHGSENTIAVELDGFAFHSARDAFTYDRLRQNDLQTLGWLVLRFSYDAIRTDTLRCVRQLQAALLRDPQFATFVRVPPDVQQPEMEPNPLAALSALPPKERPLMESYFDTVRPRINVDTLRGCQTEAFGALANYFGNGGRRAACVMSVGAGKTVLGVVTALAFARRRALIITPGSVIRGTFDRAFDHTDSRNALYALPGGPLIPGCRPPSVLTLDRDDGPIRSITRTQLLAQDVLITNFHSLGTGEDADDLLTKLQPDDIDLIVVDEAHIAAAESYQRTFAHFINARTLLMSACFQRLDGRPIDADVVYRYRLIDSIADGHAKNLAIDRFAPHAEETTYEMINPDGSRDEIIGRDALLALLGDERKLARITARSDAPIRQVMRLVRSCLDKQAERLEPIRPRVLFAALGERHAEQIARIANEYHIPCETLHHSMPSSRIRTVRDRFERESGDLQGIVQLKMLGQGYDFPPISVVVPMRPYRSFSEFYQFVGRGIRVIQHPALIGRADAAQQVLDVVYHAELGLDEHIDTIYRENDMDPAERLAAEEAQDRSRSIQGLPGTREHDSAERPETFVLFERGSIEQRIVHDAARVEQRRQEREREALANAYAQYAQRTSNPVSFDQYEQVMRSLRERK